MGIGSQVLALAILAVFGIGYGKLAWRNRLVKKQEQVDEEKRIQIQELRMSGQYIEGRKSHDIPFGVRAIQSGIQVDGIWISKTSTPIPSELKIGHLRGSSTDLMAALNSVASAQFSENSSQSVRAPSSRGRPPLRQSESGSLSLDQGTGSESITAAEIADGPGHRRSYKPRRSSHLRYGSYGAYDEDTLDQLEGKQQEENKIHTQRARGSRQKGKEEDASSGTIADNERSSGASSDDSDGTLSNPVQAQAGHQRQLLPPKFLVQNPAATTPNYVLSNYQPRASFPPQSSKAKYFSIPLESPEAERLDPFTTPQTTPTEATVSFKAPHLENVREATESRESQAPLLSHTRYLPPFVPGELHVNKTMRKVNSGFEVLPAGTFGVPPEFNRTGVGLDERWNYEDDSGERRHSKLQKKTRTSMTSTRLSATLDRS
jgi:hypothetical protein